jgi:putative transposase
MPEHVHLLVRPGHDHYSISNFLRAVKQPVAMKVLSALKKERSPLLGSLRTNDKSLSESFRFWQAGGGHDLNIWSLEKAEEKARYCHSNPVTRGLAIDPGDWFWSSYRWIELGLREDQPLELGAWTDEVR